MPTEFIVTVHLTVPDGIECPLDWGWSDLLDVPTEVVACLRVLQEEVEDEASV